MWGRNKQVGKVFFKEAKEKELFVTSRFFTLQGEGPFRGQPAYFIRLAKCNLACSFCDTFFEEGEWCNFSQLLDESEQVIQQFFTRFPMQTPSWAQGRNKKMVLVITGGEPSLQNNLSLFLQQARPYFQSLQIESNGTTLLPGLFDEVTLVVSPKCLEQEGVAIRYFKPQMKVLERADCLKFVMSAPEDSRYLPYSKIPSWAHEWAEKTDKPIFISPMNHYLQEPNKHKKNHAQQISLAERSEINEVVSFWEPGLLDLKKNQRNHEYTAEYCLKYGFIFNLQMHLFASLP